MGLPVFKTGAFDQALPPLRVCAGDAAHADPFSHGPFGTVSWVGMRSYFGAQNEGRRLIGLGL